MADEATALLNQWRIDGQDAQAARLAPSKKPTSIDWGATAELPPRLKNVAIQRHSLTETDKSLPWAEFSTPDGSVKVAQGSMFPGTEDQLTYIGSEPDEQGVPQLQAEFTSPEGQRYPIRGGPPQAQAQSQPGEIKSWDDYIRRMAQRRTQADFELIKSGPSWTGPSWIQGKSGVMIYDPDHDDGTDTWLQGRLDDYANYQKKHIYKNVPEEDIFEASTADLNLRVGQPEKYGTIESSEQANWFGSGWTLHTVKGEDKTRHFFEKPETAETYNITDHPDAPRE